MVQINLDLLIKQVYGGYIVSREYILIMEGIEGVVLIYYILYISTMPID